MICVLSELRWGLGRKALLSPSRPPISSTNYAVIDYAQWSLKTSWEYTLNCIAGTFGSNAWIFVNLSLCGRVRLNVSTPEPTAKACIRMRNRRVYEFIAVITEKLDSCSPLIQRSTSSRYLERHSRFCVVLRIRNTLWSKTPVSNNVQVQLTLYFTGCGRLPHSAHHSGKLPSRRIQVCESNTFIGKTLYVFIYYFVVWPCTKPGKIQEKVMSAHITNQ